MPGAATPLVTFAEFEQMPDIEGFRRELREGHVVAVPPAKFKHSRKQLNLRDLFYDAFDRSIVVATEVGFQLNELNYLIPDVLVLPRSRWSTTSDEGYIAGAPDIVAEILSPSNRASEITAKETLSLENGALEFWLIDPAREQIRISTPSGRFHTYKPGDTIPLLYGGTIAVAAIFN